MKIAYESTIDEATESAVRITELVGTIRTWRWAGLIWTPFIFILLFLLLDEVVAKLVLGSIASVLFAVYWLSNYKNKLRKRLRKVLIKARGTDKPVPSEYELDHDGLIFRQPGVELRFSWATIASVKQTENSVEILMVPNGIAVIPTRIFSSQEQQSSWMVFIQEHTRRDEPVQVMPSHPTTEA
jgi:hypothetical protein